MIAKCALIVLYFTMLFIVTRFLEFAGIFSRGMRCSEKCTDMQMLNTKRLHKVLDHRGISYKHVIERTELIALVNGSGIWFVVLTIWRVLFLRRSCALFSRRRLGKTISRLLSFTTILWHLSWLCCLLQGVNVIFRPYGRKLSVIIRCFPSVRTEIYS